MMKKMNLLSLLVTGAMSLSLVASFPSHAAEMGEVSVGEPPVIEASIGEPPILEEPELGPPIAELECIQVEEPIVGGRSERLAYLGAMRHYYAEDGENRPLWEYADWLISQGWDPNGWLFELLGEVFPDESPLPEPIPAPEEPIVWEPEEPVQEVEIVPDFDYRKERIGYIKAMRLDYGEENGLEAFADWMITEMAWDEDLLWGFLYEAYPEESQTTARWLSENRCGLQQPEVIGIPVLPDTTDRCGLQPFEVVEVPDDYFDEQNDHDSAPDDYVEIATPITIEVGDIRLIVRFTEKVNTDEFKEYVVTKGDSLWKVAEKVYGNGRYWFILAKANTHIISNPKLIYVGQTLIVPDLIYLK